MSLRSIRSRRWFGGRALLVCAVVVGGSSLMASCLTPDTVFDPQGGEGGQAGSGNVNCVNRRLDPGETDIDCGGACEPCEIGSRCVINRDCARPPAGAASYVSCELETCQLNCLGDQADCNESADDACETDLLTNRDHCGACGAKCAPPNASGQCMNGRCFIKTDAPNQGCDPNHADCNLEPGDGCEVNLVSDPLHCGSCGDAVCSSQNGTPTCNAGRCGIDCSNGYDNCDSEIGNGCETNTSGSIKNCGQCGNVCPTKGPGWSANCVEGACGQTECGDNLGDCDGDGNCTDRLDSTDHCGGCGLACDVKNGRPACETSQCIIETCNSNGDEEWKDCDRAYETGCEVDILSSPTHCGGCNAESAAMGNGENCTEKIGSNHVTVTSCGAGECRVAGCETGWLDCNGTFEDGCEVNANTDESNCGACADAGGEVCTSKPNTVGECTGGSCDYSCTPGWVDLNQDRYMSPSDGCEARDLVVVNSGSFGSQDTGGSGPPVTIEHTLEGAPGTQRLVLVGITCRDNDNCPLTTATYGQVALRRLDETFLDDSAAKIFYALDADLPAAGTYTVTLDKNDNWGSISAEVVELSGAEQDTFSASVVKTTTSQSCDDGVDSSATLKGLPPGSLVYAVAGGPHDTAGTCSVLPPLSLSACRSENYLLLSSASAENLEGDVTVTFDLTTCFRSEMVAVGVRPESDY